MAAKEEERTFCKPCAKMNYPTLDMASRRATSHGPDKVAYRCPLGTGFHYGTSYRKRRTPRPTFQDFMAEHNARIG